MYLDNFQFYIQVCFLQEKYPKMMIRFKTSAKVQRKSQNAKQGLQNLAKTFTIFSKATCKQLA